MEVVRLASEAAVVLEAGGHRIVEVIVAVVVIELGFLSKGRHITRASLHRLMEISLRVELKPTGLLDFKFSLAVDCYMSW